MAIRSRAKSDLHVIRLLRKKKLEQGIPFMINSNMLPTDECFLEYPDGSIKVVKANTKSYDFEIIRTLDAHDTTILKRKLKLIS